MAVSEAVKFGIADARVCNAVEGQLPCDTIGANPCVWGILKHWRPLYDTLGTDNSSYASYKDNLRVINLRTFAYRTQAVR